MNQKEREALERAAALEREATRVAARKAHRLQAMQTAGEIASMLGARWPGLTVDRVANVLTIEDSAGQQYTVTVEPQYTPDSEPDDDEDDDDEPADGESFDGGFGPGSYFARAMAKDD